MKESILQFIAKPKNIFLIDAVGALITFILLFLVLRTFNTFFGLSKTTLEYLSLIAFIFSIYSFACFFLIKNNWKLYLKIICTANVLYSVLTFGILLYNYKSISVFGIAYFLGEIIVIAGLVFLEIKTIKKKFI
ncbi:cation transport ATPase [Flavobacterium sp. 2755]|nr:cation transport ATPase [Flavobacterium sp. 2755]